MGRGQPSLSSQEKEAALQKLEERQGEWESMRQHLTRRGKVSQSSEKTISTPSTSSDLRAGRK